jgi:hypothetical protein
MWFNDIDIEQRHPPWPRRIESVAPGRHEVALHRYLERKRHREKMPRRRKPHSGSDARIPWIDALTAGVGRLAAAAIALHRGLRRLFVTVRP